MSVRCVLVFPFETNVDDDGCSGIDGDGDGNVDVSLLVFGLIGVNMWVSFIVPLLPGTVYESDVCDGSESTSPKSFVYKSTLAIGSESTIVSVMGALMGAVVIGVGVGVIDSDPSAALCGILDFPRSRVFPSNGMFSSCVGVFCVPLKFKTDFFNINRNAIFGTIEREKKWRKKLL